MKTQLTRKEMLFVASMLFGMFFGAGNLIFPVSMGQLAGKNMWYAATGFLITGVGLPLLGVAALGVSRKNGLLELSSMVGRRYGLFFTCALYLTIGPFFAIPRCATVSFAVGVESLLPGSNHTIVLAIFSFLFFAAVLYFSLRPGEILTWIGKILNPLFLCFLGILVIRAFLVPMGQISAAEPAPEYSNGAFLKGILEGYNTMDALAGLAFGIVVVNVIGSLGIEQPEDVAKNTVKAGLFSCLLMAFIYILVTVVGAQSRGIAQSSANGGEGLAIIARHYFGGVGGMILAAIVTLACLKTAVGLITSCGETFHGMFQKGPSYHQWAVLFCLLSFAIANLGLNAIIEYSLPVLMFLYPMAVTLILLTLFGKYFGRSRVVYRWVTGMTAAAAFVDFLNVLPEKVTVILRIHTFAQWGVRVLPFADLGFGWVCPAITGLVLGCIFTKKEGSFPNCYKLRKKKEIPISALSGKMKEAAIVINQKKEKNYENNDKEKNHVCNGDDCCDDSRPKSDRMCGGKLISRCYNGAECGKCHPQGDGYRNRRGESSAGHGGNHVFHLHKGR